MVSLLRKIGQTGDTIVEVLLAIIIAAAVLAGAYVSANNSTNATIRDREHDEGVKLAEAQVEQLRSQISSDPSQIPAPISPNPAPLFCFYISGSINKEQTFGGGKYTPPLPALNNTDETKYENNCKLDSNSNVWAGSIPKYLVSIRRDPNGAGDNDLYEVSIRWQKAGGGWDQLTLLYRIYS